MIALLLLTLSSALTSDESKLVRTEAPRTFSSVYMGFRVILDVIWSHPFLTVGFLCLVAWVITKAARYLRDRSGEVEILLKPKNKGQLLEYTSKY
mmetsp:Transcript_13228/g.24785  ORF Transcript_13228/g.24785 Transcript_13228/m.24785 type:complete len:95 (-) Transcript_13228:1895-2179(-)